MDRTRFLTLPPPVVERLNELYDLMMENPEYIPIPQLAAFLGTKPESLRACIETNHCPFAIEWLKKDALRPAYKVPSVTFYLWYTAGVNLAALRPMLAEASG